MNLIIWDLNKSKTKSAPPRVLSGHTTRIKGIIRISNSQIISGEYIGDLRIWNINNGHCILQIPCTNRYSLYQMKMFVNDVACCMGHEIIIWGKDNNWSAPRKKFEFSFIGDSIELLSKDIYLRGVGYMSQLEILDLDTGSPLQPPIHRLHSGTIHQIQKIGENIVVTVSADGSLKVIDPITRKCYLNIKENDPPILAIAKYY